MKVFCNIGIPLLFGDSLLPFKCCDFKDLEWSINKKFLLKRSSVKHLFTSFPVDTGRKLNVFVRSIHVLCLWGLFLPWNGSFVLWCLEQTCLTIFKLDATSNIDFAIRSGDRWEPRYLYRHEEHLGFPLKVYHCRFENLPLCSCPCKNNTQKISHSLP